MNSVPNKTAAVFDFDGTLTFTDTTKYLIAALLLENPQRLGIAFYCVLQFVLKRITPQKFKLTIISSLLKNMLLQRADRVCYRFARLVKSTLRSDIIQRLCNHIEQQHLVVIATASPRFVVKKVFASETIHVIGTEFEVVEGKYTGKCLVNCYGEEKARKIKQFLNDQGLTRINYAYSDHYSDLPMFEIADRGILVHPNRKTRRLLARRLFDIVE